MKIFLKILVCVTVISVLFSSLSFESACRMLEQDVLRLHILANSDIDADQKLKLSVRDAVIKELSPLYDNVKDKNQAKIITQQNLKKVETIASDVIAEYGFNYDVEVKLCSEFFDTRYYENFTMPAGVYDSLVINIGEAKGKNWWCVMYPTLCVGASSSDSMKKDLSQQEYDVVSSDEYEFRFKIVEFFKKMYLYFC